jgi:NitT/TauT family transport system ATP-binding protein
VSKHYADRRGSLVHALEGVDLAIEGQEIACIVGPSGCGKSTLLNLIAGFDMLSTGRIDVDGVAVREAGPDRIVVFQSPSLFPWLTARENVILGPRKGGVPAARYEEDARTMLASVGLEHFASAIPTSWPAACASGCRSHAHWSTIRACR